MPRPFWLPTMAALAIAAAGLLASLDGGPVDAQNRGKLERKQARVRAERRAVEQRLKELKQAEASAARELYRAQDDAIRAREQYQAAQKKLAKTRRTLAEVKGELEGAKAWFQKQRRAFGERLVSLYERGEDRLLEAVLEARSLTEVEERAARSAAVLDADQSLLHDIGAEKQRLARAQAKHRRQAQEEQRAETDTRQAYARMETRRAAVHSELAKLKADRARAEDSYEELEETSRRITRYLQALQSSGSPSDRYSGRWSGSFLRPVSGKITSGFGRRKDPFTGAQRQHGGVDLRAAFGSSVKAAAAGLVICADRLRGYGKCVMIDHGTSASGDHYTTLYGHLLSYKVEPRDTVKRGQVIGLADSTGRSSGSHLHFEVRRNGHRVDPLTAGM